MLLEVNKLSFGYDRKEIVRNLSFTVEKGDYLFRLGSNSRDTKLCAKVVLDRMTIIKRVTNVMEPSKELKFL